MRSFTFYNNTSAQLDVVPPPCDENVSVSSDSVLNVSVLNNSALNNTSLGLSESAIDELQIGSDVVNLSDISVEGISSNDTDNNRPKRQKKETDYNELNNNPEVSESEEEFVPENNKVKVNETPYRRKAGRPKGSKNKKKGPKSMKGKIHHIRPKNQKNPQVTTVSNQSNLLNINVDDEENKLKPPPPNGNELNELNDSIISETGCTSPVKKKSDKKTRKRQINKKEWKGNVRKELKNSGKEYTTKNKDGNLKTHKAREIGPPCKCKSICFLLLDSQTIEAVFENYWKLGDYNQQSQYLAGLIDRTSTKNQLKYGEENKSRVKCINKYHIQYEDNRIVVCKEAFISILGITKDTIQHNNRKRTESGIVEPDQRGKHVKYAIPESQLQLAHKHIQKIPARSSHYTRNSNEHRQYVDTLDKKSQCFFFGKYLEWMEENHSDAEPLKKSMYLYIFNNFYNLEIVSPKVDVCDVCTMLLEKLKQLRDKNKDTTDCEAELSQHKTKANVAYEHLKQAHDPKIWRPDEWLVICMDLQQTFVIPKTAQGSHYYLPKVNVYNFCIYELQSNKPFFYVWEEFNGRKGSSEIYSCIYKWLNENVLHKDGKKVNGQERPRKLRLIADNCGGQAKNNNLSLALLRLVHQGVFDRIELFFLVPGHTYMDCDRKFGHISKSLKNIQTIGSPDRLVMYIRRAQTPHLNVVKIRRDEIVNVSVLTTKKNEDRVALIRRSGNAFQQASVIVLRKKFPNGYILKENVTDLDEAGKFINLQTPEDLEEGKQLDFSKIELKPKYPTEIKLKKNKMDSLKKMRESLGQAGDWIPELIATQENAQVYKNDDDCDEIFPRNLNSNDEVPKVIEKAAANE